MSDARNIEPLNPYDKTPWYMWTVYYGANDLPAGYAVRRWNVNNMGKRSVLVCQGQTTLEEARSYVPEGLTRVLRQPTDDPVIVESWI